MSGPEQFQEIKLSKHGDLLKSEQASVDAATVAADFGKAFIQSAAIDPVWNGLGQLASGGNLPRVSIINEENARISKADAWAQKFGSAFGIAADLVLLSKGKNAIFGGHTSEALAKMSLHERALSHGLDGIKLGAFYGAVLTPSHPDENLLWGRVANAGSQAVTFGMLNYGSQLIASAHLFKNIKADSAGAVLKDMGSTSLSGAIAGPAGVVTDSILRNHELKLEHMGEAAIDFAVIGFAMSGMHHGIRSLSAADANGVTKARHITDSLGLSRPADLSGKMSEFRIAEGKAAFDNFYATRLQSEAPAQASIQVQQRLHTALSGLFGERFASYSEARPLLLRHAVDTPLDPALLKGNSLIADCKPLPAEFQAKDVFPARSNSGDTSIWLQPAGENALRLMKERPAVSDTSAKEAVMLGLSRLPRVDATQIKVGEELIVNNELKLKRDLEGKLWAEASPESAGIWTRLNPGQERKVNLNEPIYSGDELISPELIRSTADSAAGREVGLGNSSATAFTKGNGDYYLRGPVATADRIYTKAEPGLPVEVAASSKFIHLGPRGILPIENHLVTVPKAPVEKPAPATEAFEAKPGADPTLSGKPQVMDPFLPEKPTNRIDLLAKPEPPAAPKDRPVVNVPVEDLGILASRLTGETVVISDPNFRHGKFGEVVLDPAKGGVDAGDGTIRLVFSDYDAALSAGRFTTGIFKRRLQTDPNDRNTAPSMKVTVDEFQTPSGEGLYVPVIDIRGVGAGRLVIGDNLRPLGIQNSENLITIDQKTKPRR